MDPHISQFTTEYFAIVNKMADSVQQLVLAGLSKEEILLIIAKKDFKKMILSDPEFKGSYQKLNGAYVSTLRKIKKFADISPDALAALTQVSQTTWINKLADDIAVTLKSNLTNGVLGGLNTQQIIAGIAAEIRPDQIETLAVTALSNYTAGLNALMAEQLPKKTSYVYTGPTDERTRAECLEMMGAGPMTQQEISDRYPGAWIARGGYNCRHQWAPFTKEVSFYNPKKAIALMSPA